MWNAGHSDFGHSDFGCNDFGRNDFGRNDFLGLGFLSLFEPGFAFLLTTPYPGSSHLAPYQNASENTQIEKVGISPHAALPSLHTYSPSFLLSPASEWNFLRILIRNNTLISLTKCARSRGSSPLSSKKRKLSSLPSGRTILSDITSLSGKNTRYPLITRK